MPSTSQAQNVTVPPDRPWEVSAGSFEFAIKSPIAIKLAAVEQGDPVNSSVDGTGQPIYARPMDLSGQMQDTTLSVDIYTEHTNEKTKEIVKTTHANFRILADDSNVPVAMWGYCKSLLPS